jgi:galactonate dehydratase
MNRRSLLKSLAAVTAATLARPRLSTAGRVNVLSTYSQPVLFEYNYGDRRVPPLPQCIDFKNGKIYPNDRPSLGVTVDMAQLRMGGEVTPPGASRLYYRTDGSLTHW